MRLRASHEHNFKRKHVKVDCCPGEGVARFDSHWQILVADLGVSSLVAHTLNLDAGWGDGSSVKGRNELFDWWLCRHTSHTKPHYTFTHAQSPRQSLPQPSNRSQQGSPRRHGNKLLRNIWVVDPRKGVDVMHECSAHIRTKALSSTCNNLSPHTNLAESHLIAEELFHRANQIAEASLTFPLNFR